MSFTQREACLTWVELGASRVKQGPLLAFGKAFMGGVFLSMGGLVALAVGGVDGPMTTLLGAGVNKVLTAAIFPIGIIMMILHGGDLVTGNIAFLTLALYKRRIPLWAHPAYLTIAFVGNLFGSLWVAGIFGYYSDIFAAPAAKAYVIAFATGKVITPSWPAILLRGFGCNFLVCVGVWQTLLAKDILSKIVALWMPIFLFVALAYDHVVANMLFIPLALMLGADFSVGKYIWKSMIPSLIGNVFGGLFIAAPLIYFHLAETGSKMAFMEEPVSDLEEGHSEVNSVNHPIGPGKV
ncbi:hypothetical protein RQP46_003659 [Phenoliferia psychrophenolica]